MNSIGAALAAGGKGTGFDWTPVWPLVGVVVAGLFALAGHGMVPRAARGQAEAQMARDLSKWHRELRRQSYVDCILAYEKLRDMIVPLSRAIPWPVSHSLTSGEAAEQCSGLVDRFPGERAKGVPSRVIYKSPSRDPRCSAGREGTPRAQRSELRRDHRVRLPDR